MIATIADEDLHAFRAASTMSSLRALGTSIPVLAASLHAWRPELMILVVIAAVVVLASGWSSIRALQELALPLRERFVIADSVLIRYVADEEAGRIPKDRARALMRNSSGFTASGNNQQIIIPCAATGFEELVRTLATWGNVITPPKVFSNVSGQVGMGGLIKIAMSFAALLYFVWSTGTWVNVVIGFGLGGLVAEVIGRLAVGRSRQRLARR